MIFKSPYPDIEIRDTALTPLVFRHEGRLRDKAAITDLASGRSYTYGELLAGARRLAAGLAARGFGNGGVIAMLTRKIRRRLLRGQEAAASN